MAIGSLISCWMFDTPPLAAGLFIVELEQAVSQRIDRNEFRLDYQPRIDVATGAVSSVETLGRWEHPEHGLIGPMQFIPYAEESGLIVHLGKWILREACRQNAAWRRKRYPALRMAVNGSGRQFSQHDFVNSVASILSDTGMMPKSLELELTETVFMHEAERTASAFGKLRKMGVQLAIDDFGSGSARLFVQPSRADGRI